MSPRPAKTAATHLADAGYCVICARGTKSQPCIRCRKIAKREKLIGWRGISERTLRTIEFAGSIEDDYSEDSYP